MFEFAETISSSSSLSNLDSPQRRAVEWLADDKINNNSNWSGYELLQRYVLRVLYLSTDGDNWSNSASTSWFGASSVCQWPQDELFCNGQQVDYIDLYSDDLQGEIPEELGQLTALTGLRWHRNQLTGTIPTHLGHLTALIDLRLYFNQLSGPIPSQLGQLTALTRMDLRDNELTGPIPSQLGQLTALTELNLSENQLIGTIPVAFTQLTNLSRLYLNNNILTGQVPSGFCAAPFPDWRADGSLGTNRFYTDCISEVQCDCCDRCYDESGSYFSQ